MNKGLMVGGVTQTQPRRVRKPPQVTMGLQEIRRVGTFSKKLPKRPVALNEPLYCL